MLFLTEPRQGHVDTFIYMFPMELRVYRLMCMHAHHTYSPTILGRAKVGLPVTVNKVLLKHLFHNVTFVAAFGTTKN